MSERKISTRDKLLGTTSRFAGNEAGAVAVWFSILLVPMLGFTYGAIKFSQLAEQRSGMIDAMDASALALARQFEFEDLEPCDIAEGDTETAEADKEKLLRYAREFFDRNYPEHTNLYADEGLTKPLDVATDLTFDLTCSTVVAKTRAYSDMGGILARYFGVGAIPLNLRSEISLPGSGRVEIALVLDVTGSMGNKAPGDDKDQITKLKEAVDVMLNNPKFYGKSEDGTNDFVRISVVPFNSMVNPGAAYEGRSADKTVADYTSDWIDGWGGVTPKSFWHGANFMHAERLGTVTADNGTTTPRPIVIDQKVNHLDLFNSVRKGNDPATKMATWKGCVEARPFPLDEVATPIDETVSLSEYQAMFEKPASVTADTDEIEKAWSKMPSAPSAYDPREKKQSYFVPFFAPDEPDCAAGACGFSKWEGDPYRAFASGSNENFPGIAFDDVQGTYYDNELFVYDTLYTSNHPYWGENDASETYRNLVLDARASLKADGVSGCTGSKYPGTGGTDLEDAMDKFGYVDCNTEYKFRPAYVGTWDDGEKRYVGKYDLNLNDFTDGSDQITSPYSVGTGPNSGCSASILPLTTSKKAIRDKVQSLKYGGTTNTALGLVWGWRTLTHEAPFVEGADPDTKLGRRWRKHVVLMTDGDNFFQSTDTYNQSYFGPYGYAREDRLGIGADEGDTQEKMQDELSRKTIRICHRMREANIKVYTVGFNIKKNSAADKMLAACAIEKEAYRYAKNGDDLAKAFESITSQIVELHISG